jgi:hypothetical protein
MSAALKILSAMAGLCILLCQAAASLAGEHPVPEGRLSRIEFTAETERSEARSAWRNLSVHVSGGCGWPGMDRVNRYVRYINRNFAGTASTIDRYRFFGFGLEWALPRSCFIGLHAEKSSVDTDGRTEFLGVSSRLSIDIETAGIELYGGRQWPRLLGPLGLQAMAGAGCYRSRYREKENGYRVSGTDYAPGFRGGVGILYDIGRHVCLQINAQYRLLSFDSYSGSGNRIKLVSPGAPNAKADYSGMTLETRAVWKF